MRRLAVFGSLAGAAIAVAIAAFAACSDDTASSPPRIGRDHWHARYVFEVCGDRQPNAPFWHAGVNTENDGIIHISPFTSEEEGRGARLVKWFEYGGGVLTDDEVRLPGGGATHRNGEECEDGFLGTVQVYVTPAATGVEERVTAWDDYVPQDGDLVVIKFAPEP